MSLSPTVKVVTARVAVPPAMTADEPRSVSAPQGLEIPSGTTAELIEREDFVTDFRRTVGPATDSQNAMVPSEEPVGAGATVPVSVTLWPSNPGLGEAASLVTVAAAAVMVSVTGSEVE